MAGRDKRQKNLANVDGLRGFYPFCHGQMGYSFVFSMIWLKTCSINFQITLREMEARRKGKNHDPTFFNNGRRPLLILNKRWHHRIRAISCK